MSEPSGEDAAAPPADPLRLPRAAEPAPAPDRPDFPEADLEDVLRRRVPTRVRVAQAGALLLVIAVAAGLVVHSVSLAPGRSSAGVASPTPVPLGPILLLSNVSFGTVTLNGAPLAGSPPLVTAFRRGLNTLTLTAPPFRPRTCRVQWPGSETDGGCFVTPRDNLPHSVGGRPVAPALIVDLPFGPEDLSAAAQSQALAAIIDVLQRAPPQTTVPAGDYIAVGQDAGGATVSRRTDVPLRAELLAAATSLAFNGVFCDDPGCVRAGTGTAAQPEWAVTVGMAYRWRFGTSTGVVANSAAWPGGLPTSVLLAYDARQGWSLDQSSTEQLAGFGLPAALAQTVCDGGMGILGSAAQQQGDTVQSPLHDNRLEGCELALQTAQGASDGHFVWRFGVLLAADERARALLPALPLAPVSELAAVGG